MADGFCEVYENKAGDTFVRTSDRSGEVNNTYEVTRESKAAMDRWLLENGYAFIGVDDVD
mgnify:CR=1 FL=1